MFSSISPMLVIHSLVTLQSLGIYFMRQRSIALVSSYGVTARNKGVYKVVSPRCLSILQEDVLLVF